MLSSSKFVRKMHLLLQEEYIRRLATNSSVTIGSLYDIRLEKIVGQLQLGPKATINISQQNPSECDIMKNDRFFREETYRGIGIHDEPWLNMLLGITPALNMDAVCDYSPDLNANSRYLYFYHCSQEQTFAPAKTVVIDNIPTSIPDISITHVVSTIRLGVQVLIVLHLPSTGNEHVLDRLLNNVKQQLIKHKYETASNKKTELDQITVTKVFSNVPGLDQKLTFTDLCQKIANISSNKHCHHPIEFTLRSISWFYPFYPTERMAYSSLTPYNARILKQYLISITVQIKQFEVLFDSKTKSFLDMKLKQQYEYFQERFEQVKMVHLEEIDCIHGLVTEVRAGKMLEKKMNEIIFSPNRKTCRDAINSLSEDIRSFEETENLKTMNNKDNIGDSSELKNSSNTNVHSIAEQQLNNSDQQVNTSISSTPSTSDVHLAPTINSSKENSDFSQSPSLKHNRSIVTEVPKDTEDDSNSVPPQSAPRVRPSSPQSNASETVSNTEECPTENRVFVPIPPSESKPTFSRPLYGKSIVSPVPSESEPTHKKPRSNTSENDSSDLIDTNNENKQMSVPPVLINSSNEHHEESSPIIPVFMPGVEEPLPPKDVDVNHINILLLGESGVGKSTFINALANYYTFGSFEEARTSPPLVVLPVSFLVTTGDNFEEKTVHFGDVDSNENHNDIGQSVTQHCRSYVFSISDQTKLRIIDTPGMGDTRGLEQDDTNMERIISYISNLSHLNAICILLKPNESRLTIVLRSYFTRLLNFIGENAHHSIVFCFTNTRSTFYAPGNTGPLLRKMLADLPNKDIKFEKRNTFCFDSEALRYLIASRNGIEFDAYQRKDYEQSWKKSSEVSNDLINYICNILKPCSQKEWHSLECLQLQMKQLIRPLLETTRNTLRNMVLLNQNSSKLIKLSPETVSEPLTICYKCERNFESFAEIAIYPDDLHRLSDSCDKCNCEQFKHVIVDYKLHYNLIESNDGLMLSEYNENFTKLRLTILEFGKFYGYIISVQKKTDLLLPALKRIVAEENEICSQKEQNCLNMTIYEKLSNLKNDYMTEQGKAISIGVPISVSDMFQIMDDIYEIDDINAQINVIKRTQENYIKQHEKEVSFTNEHIFL